MPASQRMTSVDTAWLRMDRPNNLMMIVGVLTFATRVDLKRVRAVVAERMLGYRRFRQTPRLEATGAVWRDDPDFKLERHVVRLRIGHAQDAAALQEKVGELAVTPLDPAHPLWEFGLLERYGGGSALVVRLHHCYADGIALIGVMLSLTDPTAAASLAPRGAPTPDEPSAPDEAHDANPLAELLGPITQAITTAAKMSGNVVGRASELLQNPGQLVRYAQVGAGIAAEIAQLAMMPDDSPTRFKGVPRAGKRVAWTNPLPLDHVKAVGRALQCSVNDVLLGCVAGALQRYLADHGEAHEEIELRAMVPVNLRAQSEAGKLGNCFGLVALVLPVGMTNPIARLHAVRARMNALKNSYQAPLTLGILGLGRYLPEAGTGADSRSAREQGDRGDDQRARPAAAALPRRRGTRIDDVLGAAVGQYRHGRLDLVLQRHGAVRVDHRRRSHPGPRGDRRAVRQPNSSGCYSPS